MREPLLSIVIPTRDRHDCAASVARGLSESLDQDFEAVIHDNSSDARLGSLVAELADPRIRYIHVDESLNMHGNFDRAVAAARGRYVCVIGDDDGMIVSEALKVLDRAERRDADAVITAVPAFTWPGTRHWYWGDVGGTLVGLDVADEAPETMLDPRLELERVFANGIIAGLGRMPRIYQGFVRRRSLTALFDRCGTYFPGPSPDMANAVGLVPFVNRILLSARPTVISGHSPRSGGGAGAAGKHHGRLEDQPHLPAGTIESWNDAVPRFWSGLTIYAQSAIAACAATGQALPRLGFHRHYAACLVYERRQYWRDVGRALRLSPGNKGLTAVRTGLTSAGLLAVRTRTFIGNFLLHRLRRGGKRFQDIAEVMRECERRLSGEGRSEIGVEHVGVARAPA